MKFNFLKISQKCRKVEKKLFFLLKKIRNFHHKVREDFSVKYVKNTHDESKKCNLAKSYLRRSLSVSLLLLIIFFLKLHTNFSFFHLRF